MFVALKLEVGAGFEPAIYDDEDVAS